LSKCDASGFTAWDLLLVFVHLGFSKAQIEAALILVMLRFVCVKLKTLFYPVNARSCWHGLVPSGSAYCLTSVRVDPSAEDRL